jgi:hypothetical protein
MRPSNKLDRRYTAAMHATLHEADFISWKGAPCGCRTVELVSDLPLFRTHAEVLVVGSLENQREHLGVGATIV